MRRRWLSNAGLLVLIGASVWALAWSGRYSPIRVGDLTFVSLEPFHGERQRDNLHLRFRSYHNLRKLAEEAGVDGAYANISLCPFHENPWVSIGRVRHNDVDLGAKPMPGTDNDTPAVHAEMASLNKSHGPFFYDVYFGYYEQWLTYKSLGTTQRRIPLPHSPKDLCVRIHGDGGPPGLQSNVLVVPRAELARALRGWSIPPLAPRIWNDDPGRLSCPRAQKFGRVIALALGPNHGSELAIHRLSDNTWFVLVTGVAPPDMQILMTPKEYAQATHLELSPDVTGYKWWSLDGKQEPVFTGPGQYDLYSSSYIENSHPGLGCSITLSK